MRREVAKVGVGEEIRSRGNKNNIVSFMGKKKNTQLEIA
jgi:hypothetical protein